jgi:hypothetical protein
MIAETTHTSRMNVYLFEQGVGLVRKYRFTPRLDDEARQMLLELTTLTRKNCVGFPTCLWIREQAKGASSLGSALTRHLATTRALAAKHPSQQTFMMRLLTGAFAKPHFRGAHKQVVSDLHVVCEGRVAKSTAHHGRALRIQITFTQRLVIAVTLPRNAPAGRVEICKSASACVCQRVKSNFPRAALLRAAGQAAESQGDVSIAIR